MLRNDSANDLPIASDMFKYHNINQKVKLCLHSDCIKLYNISLKAEEQKYEADKIYYMRDIVGCSVGKGQKQNDVKAYFTIYMYPRINVKTLKRKREALEFDYSIHGTYQKNLECVNDIATKLNKILSRSTSDKPFLVYINPNSGSGKARSLFLERIKPVWAEANIPFAVIMTKHANYAFKHIQDLDLKELRGILVVSGDGLVYEVINGLMSRPDWREAIKTPIGQLPGGSGNAFAASICYAAREPYSDLSIESFAMHMGFLTSKYDVLPMDLVAVDITPPENKRNTIISERIYSFLSIEWAIIADVDYESEKYRFLGGFRFIVGALTRILNLRIYRGRLSFKPSSGSFIPKSTNLNIIQQPIINQNEVPVADINDLSRPKTHHLVPLNQPVPKDWVVIEDNFILVLVIHKPLIAQDFLAWPDSQLENNEMLVIFIKEGITKIQLLKLFGETETGNYINNDLVESVRVKAFRIEPLVDHSYLMVDGEKVEYGPIQGEILEPMLNCIGKRIESN